MKTQEEKDQIKAKAKATKEANRSPDAVAVATEFGPAWQALEKDIRTTFREAGLLVAEMVAALDLPYTVEGKDRLSSMVRVCTDAPDLRKAASMWCAIIMSDQKIESITTWKELRAGSIAGNEKLGVKRRGKSKDAVQAGKAAKLGEDVWGALDTINKSEAFWARMRKWLNDNGMEMTARLKADAKPLPVLHKKAA